VNGYFMDYRSRTTPRWPPSRVLRWAAVAVLLVALAASGGAFFHSVYRAAQAERDLHLTLFVIRLVERFVTDRGHWPRSWEELEGLAAGSDPPHPHDAGAGDRASGVQSGYDWPAATPEVRRWVVIDFDADPAVVAAQDPMSFTAVRPVTPGFEYRYSGDLESLQATLRKVAAKKVPGGS
jgi:hypothetical protein